MMRALCAVSAALIVGAGAPAAAQSARWAVSDDTPYGEVVAASCTDGAARFTCALLLCRAGALSLGWHDSAEGAQRPLSGWSASVDGDAPLGLAMRPVDNAPIFTVAAPIDRAFADAFAAGRTLAMRLPGCADGAACPADGETRVFTLAGASDARAAIARRCP